MKAFNMRENVCILFLLFGATLAADTVKVSVYYESLCPDSRQFIVNQLFPTYVTIGKDINVDLVPFGNAKVINATDGLKFECQHGPKECYGNEIHSCAVDLVEVDKSTEFVYCSMKSDDPSSNDNLEACAEKASISWSSLETCYSSGEADKLLAKNGVRTMDVTPPIQGVPTVIFNDHYNDTLQDEALEDFLGVVCSFLDDQPEPCKKQKYSNYFNKIEVRQL